LDRKHDIDPELRTASRNHIKFPNDPANIRKPLNHVDEIKKRVVKVVQIDKHPSVPSSSVKRSGTVKHASLNNLMNKRRKVTVSGEKTVVMSTLPFSSFPEIDRNTEMR
jgi:CRISPR/Cas system CSM-associated protein Csm5 (group 7 of RAMP superfamily)